MILIYAILLCVIAANSSEIREFKCEFTNNAIFGYSCEFRRAEWNDRANEIISRDNHLKNKSDKDVKMVSFIDSDIKFIHDGIFSAFINLEILDVSKAKMTTWTRGDLKGAKKLKRLVLAQNELTEIADNSFLGAITLEHLSIDANKIAILNDKAFNALTMLQSLDLSGNLLTIISANVLTPLKKLESINLSGNKITIIEEGAFIGNTRLEFLNLQENLIEKLDENAFTKLTSLTILYLHQNKIADLPEKIFQPCQLLMEIRLDDNNLTAVHKYLFWFNKKLKMINMMGNPLESFDAYYLNEETELLYIGEFLFNLLFTKYNVNYFFNTFLDDSVNITHVSEKLEVFTAESNASKFWTKNSSTENEQEQLPMVEK